jgi:F-type H+-transporting ATPase subunit epsilon
MLRLNVVTPERAFLDEECVSVTLPGVMGELQILEGHTPCLLQLKTGLVSYENKDRETIRFMIAAGFVEVDHDQVNVLCELARRKDEIDKASELLSQQELNQQIEKLLPEDDDEQKRLNAELANSVARLSLLD